MLSLPRSLSTQMRDSSALPLGSCDDAPGQWQAARPMQTAESTMLFVSDTACALSCAAAALVLLSVHTTHVQVP